MYTRSGCRVMGHDQDQPEGLREVPSCLLKDVPDVPTSPSLSRRFTNNPNNRRGGSDVDVSGSRLRRLAVASVDGSFPIGQLVASSHCTGFQGTQEHSAFFRVGVRRMIVEKHVRVDEPLGIHACHCHGLPRASLAASLCQRSRLIGSSSGSAI